ncbi:uncharacterized protein LOC106512862, partial [Austrofundulus limnaeus]|uniref:Uncharacterized protein LOC106512862 n=1 Tax=Austrofundulus limnaeus TaxID=52670 RepID=A0A2I4AMT4_AUSLI
MYRPLRQSFLSSLWGMSTGDPTSPLLGSTPEATATPPASQLTGQEHYQLPLLTVDDLRMFDSVCSETLAEDVSSWLSSARPDLHPDIGEDSDTTLEISLLTEFEPAPAASYSPTPESGPASLQPTWPSEGLEAWDSLQSTRPSEAFEARDSLQSTRPSEAFEARDSLQSTRPSEALEARDSLCSARPAEVSHTASHHSAST